MAVPSSRWTGFATRHAHNASGRGDRTATYKVLRATGQPPWRRHGTKLFGEAGNRGGFLRAARREAPQGSLSCSPRISAAWFKSRLVSPTARALCSRAAPSPSGAARARPAGGRRRRRGRSGRPGSAPSMPKAALSRPGAGRGAGSDRGARSGRASARACRAGRGRVADQKLAPPHPPGRADRVGDLVGPGARGELIAAFAGCAKEAEPDLVDGERVGLERSRSQAWVEELAAVLDAVGDRLRELGSRLGQVPRARSGSELLIALGLAPASRTAYNLANARCEPNAHARRHDTRERERGPCLTWRAPPRRGRWPASWPPTWAPSAPTRGAPPRRRLFGHDHRSRPTLPACGGGKSLI